MIIRRVIDGKTYEFELDSYELNCAYYEAQERFDTEDMESYAEMFLESYERFSVEDVSENIQDIAREFRDMMDQHDWWGTAEEAFLRVLV